MPLPQKVLFGEGLLLCAIVKIMVVALPFRITQQILRLRAQATQDPILSDIAPNVTVQTVFRTIDSISRRVFWTNTCLVRSITIKLMLRRRHIPSVLYLGLAKDVSGQLKAHAWLRIPSTNQVYDDGSRDFTTVAVLV